MSLDELLAFSLGQQKDLENNISSLLSSKVEDFLWELNTDKKYFKESYGGKIEKGFHPSGLAGVTCARKIFFEYIGQSVDERAEVEEEIPPKLRKIFDNGHSVHDRWQNYLTLMSSKDEDLEFVGDWICQGCNHLASPDKEITKPDTPCPKCGSKNWKYNEFRLSYEPLRLVGKRDGKLIIKGKEYLIEIKSMNTFQFKKLREPTPGHLVQFNLYMLMSGCKEGIFIYEDKNTQDTKMFKVSYNSSNLATELSVLEEANKAIDENRIPAAQVGFPTSPKCKKCPFKQLCLDM